MSNCLQPTSNCGCQPCVPCVPCVPTSSILKCGNSGSATITTSITTPLTIATVSIDTSCLRTPTIKLEFASNINFSQLVVALGASATVNFQVFKICGAQRVPVSGTWTFARSTAALAGLLINTTDTFSFITCECDSCPQGCCTYTVEVTADLDILGAAGISNSRIIISNATLSALAVGPNI